ncbi:2TM domain-containing protein [Terrabacter sp. 2RAF25]|uniref:2TM domain-containing protein n=1 Tax=Terrabacter sp. 2RAF25 TaxID=3232998 RepID=UPI003F9B6726
MTANQLPVDPTSDAPEPRVGPTVDPTVDRVVAEDDLRGRALDRLKKKADFRAHLLIYCLVNAVVLVVWAMTSHGFFWPVFVLAGWGIGLVANFYEAYVRDDPSEAQVAAEIERLRRR